MKMIRLLCLACLLLAVLLPGTALAQDEGEFQIEESVTIVPTFPSVESIAGGTFEYLAEISYRGLEDQVFDLRATAPQGWDVYMTPRYEKDRKISSITMQATVSSREEIRIVATAPFWPLPDPGDYTIKLEAVGETVSTSVDLTAEVTAKYLLSTVPTNDRYDTKATAGKPDAYQIKVQSISTDTIDNVQFTSEQPDGWLVEFVPEKIDTMDAFSDEDVDVVITPAKKAVAGDYMITLRATSAQIAADEMSIRVTVETPTIWGWVGVFIIVIVVIGLIVVFMRLSRR